jgi:hypothetical protein
MQLSGSVYAWDPPYAYFTEFPHVMHNFFNIVYINSSVLWEFTNGYEAIVSDKLLSLDNISGSGRNSWSPRVRFIFNTVSYFSKHWPNCTPLLVTDILPQTGLEA